MEGKAWGCRQPSLRHLHSNRQRGEKKERLYTWDLDEREGTEGNQAEAKASVALRAANRRETGSDEGNGGLEAPKAVKQNSMCVFCLILTLTSGFNLVRM